MRRFIALGAALLFLGVASVASAQAATVAADGAIPQPWIGIFCGPQYPQNQSFHLIAHGTGSGSLEATGLMSVDTIDLYTCAPVHLTAQVTCMQILPNNEAVVWGPITSYSGPFFFYNYMVINVQVNRPSPDTGSIHEAYSAEPPQGCNGIGYAAFNYPFAYGGAAVTP
jgi:hypothetical protein